MKVKEKDLLLSKSKEVERTFETGQLYTIEYRDEFLKNAFIASLIRDSLFDTEKTLYYQRDEAVETSVQRILLAQSLERNSLFSSLKLYDLQNTIFYGEEIALKSIKAENLITRPNSSLFDDIYSGKIKNIENLRYLIVDLPEKNLGLFTGKPSIKELFLIAKLMNITVIITSKVREKQPLSNAYMAEINKSLYLYSPSQSLFHYSHINLPLLPVYLKVSSHLNCFYQSKFAFNPAFGTFQEVE